MNVKAVGNRRFDSRKASRVSRSGAFDAIGKGGLVMKQMNVIVWAFCALFLVPGCLLGNGTVEVEPQNAWVFGGSGTDEARAVQQTSDGGYIIAGRTESFGLGLQDMYVLKTDENGNELWAKTFGGGAEDEAAAVQQTSDGGYIIAGLTASFGGGEADMYLVKTDENGNELWSKTFGGIGPDEAETIQETSDGGFIIAGCTGSFGAGGYDMYVVKTDSQGNLVWSSAFGGTDSDKAAAVQETSDGGFVVAGNSFPWPPEYSLIPHINLYLVKADSEGTLVWEKTFEVNPSKRVCGVEQTSDGGYVLAGNCVSADETYELSAQSGIYLLRTDADGNLVWEKTLDEPDGSIHAMCPTSDGGYVLVGELGQKGFAFNWRHGYVADIVAVKTDGDGDVLWSKTIGSGNTDESAFSVQQTDGGAYILAGRIAAVVPRPNDPEPADAYVVRLDADGNPL